MVLIIPDAHILNWLQQRRLKQYVSEYLPLLIPPTHLDVILNLKDLTRPLSVENKNLYDFMKVLKILLYFGSA